VPENATVLACSNLGQLLLFDQLITDVPIGDSATATMPRNVQPDAAGAFGLSKE
jgi:hypothetical protein